MQRNIFKVLLKLILWWWNLHSLDEARVGERSRQRWSISQFWTCSSSFAPRRVKTLPCYMDKLECSLNLH